jgi:hypothetical protein
MEGLENATVTPSVAPQVTPMVNPSPAAASAPAAAPAVSPEPSFKESSSDSSSLMDTIKSFNIIEVTFGILGAAALYYTIYYYKYNMTNGDKTRNEMQNRIDALEIKLAELKEEESNNSAEPLF